MGNIISASRLTSLKASVKAECQRRCYTGSVSSYAGSNYDYTTTPAVGVRVADEHYTKIMTPLNAITAGESLTVPRIKSETELAAAETKIANLAAKPLYTTSLADTGCAASCTGLCYGNCTGSCSGCSGSCSGSCDGCDGCSGCGGSCSYSCSGSCDGCSGCGSGCSGCSGCGSGCSGCSGCGGACSYGCYGCSGTCSAGCSATGA